MIKTLQLRITIHEEKQGGFLLKKAAENLGIQEKEIRVIAGLTIFD